MERTDIYWQIRTEISDESLQGWLVSTAQVEAQCFTTIVFRVRDGHVGEKLNDLWKQYNTAEKARKGHWRIVKKVRKWKNER